MQLESKALLAAYHRMRMIRAFETKLSELVTAGKMGGFMHLYAGEEAVAVGVSQQLRGHAREGSRARSGPDPRARRRRRPAHAGTEAIARAIPGARCVVLPGARHALASEAVRAAADALLSRLADA